MKVFGIILSGYSATATEEKAEANVVKLVRRWHYLSLQALNSRPKECEY